jgi:hypothetical protein
VDDDIEGSSNAAAERRWPDPDMRVESHEAGTVYLVDSVVRTSSWEAGQEMGQELLREGGRGEGVHTLVGHEHGVQTLVGRGGDRRVASPFLRHHGLSGQLLLA